jgi:hypothetical protein
MHCLEEVNHVKLLKLYFNAINRKVREVEGTIIAICFPL